MIQSHYIDDRRIGDICILNGKDAFEVFNADLKTFEPTSGTLSQNTLTAAGKSSFKVINQDFVQGELEVVFYVGGMSEDDKNLNCSRLLKECKDVLIKREGDEFEYVSLLQSFEVKDAGVDFWNTVTMKFSTIRRYGLITYHLQAGEYASQQYRNISFVFNNEGTVESGLRFIIERAIGISSMKINDITITDIKADKKYVIDGIEGSVTVDGVNCFSQTNLIEFPKVKPGKNTVNIDILDYGEMWIEYYPTFML